MLPGSIVMYLDTLASLSKERERDRDTHTHTHTQTSKFSESKFLSALVFWVLHDMCDTLVIRKSFFYSLFVCF